MAMMCCTGDGSSTGEAPGGMPAAEERPRLMHRRGRSLSSLSSLLLLRRRSTLLDDNAVWCWAPIQKKWTASLGDFLLEGA